MTRSLRQRLLLALVGLSVGSVLLAGALAAVFARQVARTDATADLRRSLAGLAAADAAGEPIVNLNRLRDVLRLQGVGLVVLTPRGQPRGELPGGVSPGDLDLRRLAAGRVEVGTNGRLVYVAQPLARKRAGTPVLVATRRVGLFGALGPVLLLAAGVAAAAGAATSVWLVRRLTRPLRAMEHTARAIAGGDFSARVEGLTGADDELAALGGAIDSMADGLQQARRAERSFLMSVSHDLRTPLTSIRGYAEAITDGAISDKEGRRRAASIIVTEAQRLERLVADLLDLARLGAREFSLHPRPVDGAAVVTAAALALGPAAADAGLRLEISAPDGPVPAEIDPERVHQVVANLVENAIRYAATTVGVETRRTGGPAGGAGGLVVAVTDDGPGVEPDEMPRLFDRLYTSRVTGRKIGTGLGLAIVRDLVVAMGGTVEAVRTSDGRTRFVVHLPPGLLPR